MSSAMEIFRPSLPGAFKAPSSVGRQIDLKELVALHGNTMYSDGVGE